MNNDREADLAALLKAVTAEEPSAPAEPPPPASPFALQLGAAIREAIGTMRNQGVIEVEDDSFDALVEEVTEAGLDTKSPKQLIKRVIQTLLESDHVEEVYGTDEEIGRSLKSLLGGD